MTFFNKKEEVIDIQLTQYGKYLLSKGKFRPHMYAFYDDNVLYDNEYSGLPSGSQNDIEGRIQEDTPSLKTQHVFSGIETNITRINELVRSGKEHIGSENILPVGEKHFSLALPLGTTKLGSEYAPSINVNFLNNEITSSISYMTGAHPTMLIPQIETRATYETSIGDTNDGEEAGGYYSKSFDDGTFIQVDDDYLLLELYENESFYGTENFDIEVFLVEEDDVSGSIYTPGLDSEKQYKQEKLIPLHFRRPPAEMKDGILLDDKSSFSQEAVELTPAFVGYWFDVLVDYEIDTDVLCAAFQSNEVKSLIGDPQFYCPEASLDDASQVTSIKDTTSLYDSNTVYEDPECRIEEISDSTTSWYWKAPKSGVSANEDEDSET